MSYLIDVFPFAPEDMELNTATILWPKKITLIFKEHDSVRAFSSFMVYFGLLDFSLYLSYLFPQQAKCIYIYNMNHTNLDIIEKHISRFL